MSSLLHSLARSFKPTNLAASGSNISRWSSSRAPRDGALPRRNWRTAGQPPLPLTQEEREDLLDEQADADTRKPKRHQADNFAPVAPPTPENWSAHRSAMKANFPEGWSPPRKLSRDAMEGLRSLHAHDPEMFSTPVLAQKFHVSPEAVRRILRSKWQPTKEQRDRMLTRERETRKEWIEKQRAEEKGRILELKRRGLLEERERPDSHRWGRKDAGPRGINSRDRLSMR